MQYILLVEDDIAITRSLEAFLKDEGYSASSAPTERKALELLGSGSFDLVLLDVGLGDGNGFNVCRTAKMLKLPVIFLTARSDEDSVVKGLDMGADDYISKPFRPRELLSRIKNVLRHYEKGSSVVAVGGLTIDTDKGTVCRDGEEIKLSALEYKLLMVFLDNRGRLLTRNQLLENIWDIAGDYVNDNTLTVYIKRLREKIEEDPQEPRIICTVRGLGYRMD